LSKCARSRSPLAASATRACWAAGPIERSTGRTQSRCLRSPGTRRRLNACPHPIGLSQPRQHTIAFDRIGHEEMKLPAITPAHDAIRMHCSSRYGCLRSRQHTTAFESITISCISWTRPRSIWMPPNGMRFSCRRSALRKVSKSLRSRAPKAVSCKRLFGGQATIFVRLILHFNDLPYIDLASQTTRPISTTPEVLAIRTDEQTRYKRSGTLHVAAPNPCSCIPPEDVPTSIDPKKVYAIRRESNISDIRQ